MSNMPSLKSRRLLIVGALLWAASFAQAANPVTFQVDMTSQAGATDVYVAGSFNGWNNSANPLINNGSGVYTGTVDIADSPGTVEYCKFLYNPGGTWESDPNRGFVLAGGPQTLPLTAWNDKYPAPNNNVTVQVDMSAQVLLGQFTNGDSTVTVSGDFTGWGDGTALTNNPALSGNASNVYSQVFSIAAFPGYVDNYKFRMNGGWESPASTGGNNRTFTIAGGDQVLPLVFYNDASLCDLLQHDTTVTFVLKITNGTPSADGAIIFDPSVNHLYLNGEFLGWWGWNTGFGGGEGPQYEMTNNPVGSDTYQQSFVVPKGKTLATTYKYSIDGFDNEAGFGVNHLRYVRNLGTSFTMPVDKFGTNNGPVLIENSFGDLAIGNPSGANIPITWSGRQCVTLQVKNSLSSGTWQDIPATEGLSFTNWPKGTGNQFFRLQKRP